MYFATNANPLSVAAQELPGSDVMRIVAMTFVLRVMTSKVITLAPLKEMVKFWSQIRFKS